MLGVDVGGTFTDVVCVRDGEITVTKVPSDARDPAAPVVAGARRLGLEGQAVFNHASTMGLNAVITRTLPKVGFLTTEGHRDMLDRGRVWRPPAAQTDTSWRRSFGDVSRPLVPRYLRRGVVERLLADGSVYLPLDEEGARAQLEVLARCNVEGVAICLINAYVNDAHERRLRELVAEVLGPELPVSISSETSPLAKEYARASTTVIDVFMKLIFTRYAHELDADLRAGGFSGKLNFADCAATLLPWAEALEKPFRIVFAGPAAGTMSSAGLGAAMGEGNLICCDVGGTSTDISLVVEGQPFVNNTFELEHDLIINALSTEISSVGAGGGSIVSISHSGEVHVGPRSAGAEVRLDVEAARAAFASLDTKLGLEERIAFAYRIAATNIAEEVANVAIRHGVDPRDFSLIAYGAAGPMLLPAALEQMHVGRVIVPPHPGLFSALGLLSSDLVYYDSRSAYVMLAPEQAGQIAAVFEDMERRLRERAGVGTDEGSVRRSFDGRLYGQSWETPFVEVPPGPLAPDTVPALIARFHDAYERRYGNRFEYVPVQGVSYRVELVIPSEKVSFTAQEHDGEAAAPAPRRTIEIRHLEEAAVVAAEYAREALGVGARLRGPAVIREGLSTTLVCPGQLATVGRFGEIVIEREG